MLFSFRSAPEEELTLVWFQWQPFMAHYTGHSGSRGIKRAADTTPGGAGPRKAGRPKKNPTQAAQPFAQSPRIHTPSTALASSLGSAGYIDKTKPHSPAMSLPPDSARFDSMDAGIKREWCHPFD